MSSIHAGISLQPESNRAPAELAVSLTSAEFREIDADAIRRAFDPFACPAAMLPWLAHAFSVDYWREGWPESRKRQVIARAIRLHFIKGTEEGLREFVGLADAAVLGITVAPSKVFSGPSLTRAEREAWLSRLPQVRVWRIGEPGEAGLKLFAGGFLYKSFFAGKFCQPSSALSRLRRRARWIVGGIETDITVEEFGSYFRLRIKGEAGKRVFAGRPSGGRFYQPSTAAERLVTIAPRDRLPWRAPVGPRLDAVTAEPERVVERGNRDRRVFAGTAIRSGYFQPSQAWRRIYQRFAVYDGSHLARRPSVQFMGVGRYGFPAHTAEVRVSVPGRRSPWAAGDGVFIPGARFFVPHDASRTDQLRRAIRASMRLSDRILLQYGQRPRFVAGLPFLAGVDSTGR